MFPDRFDRLREHLLRAGIAPRHVKRYVAELRDHFHDLVREETENGLARDAAEVAAHARIGTDDDLSGVMATRSDLRSITARFPSAVFGVGPVLMLALFVEAALLIQGGMILWSPPIPQWSVPWGKLSFDALNWLATYAAPLLIAAVLFIIGIRQRMTTNWILLGLAIICVVGGFHEIGVRWSSVPNQPNELYVGFALAPPFPRYMLIARFVRAAINLGVVSAAYWLWMHTRPYARE